MWIIYEGSLQKKVIIFWNVLSNISIFVNLASLFLTWYNSFKARWNEKYAFFYVRNKKRHIFLYKYQTTKYGFKPALWYFVFTRCIQNCNIWLFLTIFDKHNDNMKSVSQAHKDLMNFIQNGTNKNLVISNMQKLYNKQICQILMFLLRFC